MQKQLISKALNSIGIKVVAAFVAIALNYFVVDIYGIDDSSTIFLIITSLLISSVFIRFGFDNLIVRMLGRRNKYSSYLQNIVWSINLIAVFIWAISAFIIMAIVIFYFKSHILNTFLFLTALLFFSLMQINSYVYQGLGKVFLHTVFLNLLFSLLCIIFSLLIVAFELDVSLLSYLIIQAMSSFISYILSICFTSRPNKQNRFILNKVFKFVLLNVKYFMFAIMQIVLVWMPQIFLYFSEEKLEVPTFTFMHRLSLILGFVLISISAFFTPRFSRFIVTKDFLALEKESALFIWLSVIFCFSAGVTLYLIAEPTLMVLNKETLFNGNVFIILFIGQLVNCATGPALKLLQMNGSLRIAGRIQFLVFAAHFILGLLLLNTFSIVHAAVICTSIMVITNIAYTYLVYSEMNLNVYKRLFKFK